MTKQEFISRIKSTNIPAYDEYLEIEYVYTWHPSIDNVKGKDQIANLWDIGGIRLIRDMMPTAQKAEEFETKIAAARAEIQKLQSAYIDLTSGGNGNMSA